ncbi:MAG: sigma-54-dependent Fis family transcriptional regulator [Fibrobacteria bacterium]|nr:sigma-54-dependent Fis family transcriptional regulator [Fibrobacteria bacterium]
MTTIAVVDDEKNIRNTLKDIIEDMGYTADVYESGETFLNRSSAYDVVLMDIRMPGKSGMDVLQQLKSERCESEFIIISGHGSIDVAVDAVKSGAYDFLQKPLSLEKVEITLKNALAFHRQKQELREWHESKAAKYKMIGSGAEMEALKAQILKVAPTHSRVFILGQSGTGKELIAHAIHNNSPRKSAPFVKINCAAIPENLIESELFGHAKGAFTGAIADKTGKFELAHQGTLFLDEIGDLSLPAQSKLLRVLEESEFEKVGGLDTIKVDVRVIAATHIDLEKRIEQDAFRQDLFFRINVFQIKVPTLEERSGDIQELSRVFLDGFCRENELPNIELTEDALQILENRKYPGNIRELKNIVERLAILSEENKITAASVEQLSRDGQATQSAVFNKTMSLADAKFHLEKLYVETQLRIHENDIQATAESLKIERTNLYRKLKQLGIKTGN